MKMEALVIQVSSALMFLRNLLGTGAGIALNGTTAIPDGVTPANKRMRIRYDFSSSSTALHVSLAIACSDMGNGAN